jgi:hypothetical protein
MLGLSCLFYLHATILNASCISFPCSTDMGTTLVSRKPSIEEASIMVANGLVLGLSLGTVQRDIPEK